jgi:protein transport protein SEC39
MSDHLSKDHVVLLAVNYASESSISALRLLASQRQDALTTDLILRVLLTFLPESVDPSSYTQFVDTTTSGTLSEQQHEPGNLDISPIQDISEKQARKRVKALRFLPLNHPSCPSSEGLLTNFIVSRAHQLDTAGLLLMVPNLAEPFLERSDYLRIWFVSSILPLLRFGYEYYPDNNSIPSLDMVETATGSKMVEIWLSKAFQEPIRKDHEARSPTEEDRDVSGSVVARDIK